MARVHFIGIGGSGLSAIATVLLERGESVSGSDRQGSVALERLRQAGAHVFEGHRAENVQGADVVVRSSAVGDDNVEVQAARALGIPVLKRAEFLEYLLQGKEVIAVAGTHGKTTTTAMISWALHCMGAAPSFVVGGRLKNLGANARAGEGRFFVIEADEYDRMFLGMHPQWVVVTNIEHDHPDCYPTPEDFYQAFLAFGKKIKTGGCAFLGVDDEGARRLSQDLRSEGRCLFSYGVGGNTPDYAARGLSLNSKGGMTFDAFFQGNLLVEGVSLRVPGEHNVRNALAAMAVLHRLGYPPSAVARALEEFLGVERRFEVLGEAGGVLLINDYAHHPTEIQATLAAARLRYPQRRLWAVWQPHTFSRTRTLLDEFAAAFDQADRVVVTGIYAARESPPADGFGGQRVAEAVRKRFGERSEAVIHLDPLEAVQGYLQDHLRSGDVLLVLSAGDADRIHGYLMKVLNERWHPNLSPRAE